MWLLKDLKAEICYPLSKLISQSLLTGIVPKRMKIAKVVPVYKSREQNLFTNYRPISILPSISKVLERVVYNRLLSFLNLNDSLYQSQYGFRPGHSTVHATSEFVSEVLNSFEKNEYTVGIFLDLTKAFDSIDHNILLRKLEYYGVRGIGLNWFQNYLSDRYQFVTYRACTSQQQLVTCGVPQGSVLGPLLFLIFINDLPKCLDFLRALLFADDSTVYASFSTLQELFNKSNIDLDKLTTWFNCNKLCVNLSKTMYMILSKQCKKTDMELIISGNVLVYQTKFLGFIIDEQLNWSHHNII